jgi:hypothetical protein
VAIASVAAFLIAVRFDGLLFFFMFGLIANLFGWPALRGAKWNFFQGAFPEAQWLRETDQTLSRVPSVKYLHETAIGLAISGLFILLMCLGIWLETRSTGRFDGFGGLYAMALIASLLWFYVRMVLHYIRHIRES